MVPTKSRSSTKASAELKASVFLPVGVNYTNTAVTIKRISSKELPPLNPGMINVTTPSGSFYRFLPKGAKFSEPVTVNLPFDPELIPAGMGPKDVKTYYFDDEAKRFIPLEKVSSKLVPSTPLVASLTTHFTDMINAVIVRPEHPTTDGFNPNTVSGINAANPAANMTLVAPPEPQQDGSATVAYPIQLPPARGRYQPAVNVAYSSNRGYGVAGEGWEIPISSIEIDTRFGTPRYETADILPNLPLGISS